MIPRAIIFDFDGLILDTESAELLAWQEVFADHACTLPLELWANRIGRPTASLDLLQYLEQLAGRPIDRPAIQARRRDRCHTLNLLQPIRPGIEQLIREARTRQIPLGIASSSGREWIKGHLTRLNLLPHFQAILCREDTTQHKPDPAPYLACLTALNLPPHAASQSLALEDSPHGIASSKAAGLFTLAIPNPITQHLDLSQVDLQLPSVPPLDHLLPLLNGPSKSES